MRSACPWHLHNSSLAAQGATFTGIEVAAALPFISAGATVLSGVMSASAQQQQGDAMYRNALLRNQQAEAQAQVLKVQADQQRTAAIQEQAVAQRKAIEAQRKGSIMASRARAVMAASGGGVDEKLVNSLIGEGEYGKDVALYEGDERARNLRNQAKYTDYNADLTRWSGGAGVGMAANDRSNLYAKSGMTILGSGLQAGIGLAGKYGPSPSGGAAPKYDITLDPLRTANDADLGGYGGYGNVV